MKMQKKTKQSNITSFFSKSSFFPFVMQYTYFKQRNSFLPGTPTTFH